MAFDPVTYILAKGGANSYTDSKFDAVSAGVSYKGSVDSIEELPTSASKGDEYTVGNLGYYVYDGTNWVSSSVPGPQGEPGPQGDPGKDGANTIEAGTGIGVAYDAEEKKYTISNTQTSAEWGNIEGDIEDQTDLVAEFAARDTEISNLKNIGRFCAIWNASNGTPTSEPLYTPYAYKVGDYFRIGVAGYKVPTGDEYVPGAYDTATEETGIGDVWYYDSVQWVKQSSSGGGVVQDVQAVGVSLLNGGIANIPASATDTYGLIKESRVNTLADTKIAAEAVRFDATQSLNTSQKEQARNNINASEIINIEVW